MSVNLIDLLLLAFILLGAMLGYLRGFILGVLDLFHLVFSFLLALRFYGTLSKHLASLLRLTDYWAPPLAFILIFILSGIVIRLAAAYLLRRFPISPRFSHYNRLLGVLPGLVNGALIAAVIAPLMLMLPLPDGAVEQVRASSLANKFMAFTQRLDDAVSPVFEPALKQALNMLTVPPESNQMLRLPYKVTSARARPDLEAQMLVLVNEERAAVGLKPLSADPELTPVARKHSDDMFSRGYFSHYTPEGRSPSDRLREAGVRYFLAGENLALAPTLQTAHRGLMNSPGHRANILKRQFGRVGIGILDGGHRGLMVTQEFRD
ncbi:MAG TPA: CvpA family protein [Blastocatellia bacterium]|nr:CvpA family protein [Blastocatellia bacterium]